MFEKLVIQRTLRVPASSGVPGDGTAVARQLDAALLEVGFSASTALLDHIGGLAAGSALDLASTVVSAVRELVGDHVQHNAYFIGFPDEVPDTVEFWAERLRAAVLAGFPDDEVPDTVEFWAERLRAAAQGGDGSADNPDLFVSGEVNLLALPGYGTYQHSYADLLAARDEFVATASDRLTVLHLGESVEVEAARIYLALAASTTPLSAAELAVLSELAVAFVDGEQPAEIPVRENRAVLNGIRLPLGRPLLGIDTTTDVLRLACQASGGDVSLAHPTRFRSFPRRERRTLLAALDELVGTNRNKLGDVPRYAQRWKRLGERLHPYEYDQWPRAREVFAVARGETSAPSLAGRAEEAIRDGAIGAAAAILSGAPGLLVRSADRLLRLAAEPDRAAVLDAIGGALDSVSARVLCSLREHVDNRLVSAPSRIFTTRSRRAWVTPDNRPPLPTEVAAELTARLDAQIAARLPIFDQPVVVDPAVLEVALPLSGKATERGFAVLPRGSRASVAGEVLRFFVYWRQNQHRTDFDLSVLLLDDQFRSVGKVSYTNYHHDGVVHSGDITEAPHGATEFIDAPWETQATYVVPQVHVYAGESFAEVAESMFGYQSRGREQQGAPFDARTVRSRSDLRGHGRIALPIVFAKAQLGWQATWLQLYLRGWPAFNRVEENQPTIECHLRAIMARRHLTMSYLVDRWRTQTDVTTWDGQPPTRPVTFIGIEAPEFLPEGSQVYPLDRLSELIPA